MITVGELIARTNVMRERGRADDAVSLLAEAYAQEPSPMLAAYLGVALLEASHAKAAVATLLGALMDVGAVDAYREDLAAIQRTLLEQRLHG